MPDIMTAAVPDDIASLILVAILVRLASGSAELSISGMAATICLRPLAATA